MKLDEEQIIQKILDYGWVDPYYPPFGLGGGKFQRALDDMERKGLIQKGRGPVRQDEVPYEVTSKGKRLLQEHLDRVSSLREDVIRLAYEKPEMRKVLLPLLGED